MLSAPSCSLSSHPGQPVPYSWLHYLNIFSYSDFLSLPSPQLLTLLLLSDLLRDHNSNNSFLNEEGKVLCRTCCDCNGQGMMPVASFCTIWAHCHQSPLFSAGLTPILTFTVHCKRMSSNSNDRLHIISTKNYISIKTIGSAFNNLHEKNHMK